MKDFNHLLESLWAISIPIARTRNGAPQLFQFLHTPKPSRGCLLLRTISRFEFKLWPSSSVRLLVRKQISISDSSDLAQGLWKQNLATWPKRQVKHFGLEQVSHSQSSQIVCHSLHQSSRPSSWPLISVKVVGPVRVGSLQLLLAKRTNSSSDRERASATCGHAAQLAI